jgi:hypothetical protein
MAYVQASTGFVVNYEGREEMITQGEIFDANHPLVRTNPGLFEPMAVRFAAGPEEATTKRKRVTKAAEDESGKE